MDTEVTDVQETIAAAQDGREAIGVALRDAGVELVFGYPGGGAYQILDGILSAGIPNISARTELSAAWMSYGYNRMRRRASSACLFHVVGTLHAVPALYAAKQDSNPLLVIDANLASALDMREALQEGEEVYSSMKPLTKYIRRVVTADDLPLAVRQAVTAASTGRFGAAVLDVYSQVMTQPIVAAIEPLVLPEPPQAASAGIDDVIELLNSSERPVIIAGAGVHLADGTAQLAELAEKTGVPVVSTGRGGRGVLSDDHPLYAGPIGSFGWTSANEVVQRADLWIAVGTSFSQISTAAWTLDKPSKIVHIDIDPGQPGKIVQPTIGLVADARSALAQLNSAAQKRDLRQRTEGRSMVAAAKQAWYEAYRSRYDGSEKPMTQMHLIDVLNAELPADAICIGDSGSNAFFISRGRHFGADCPPVPNGPRYQSLGASLPIAIGTKLALPDKTVVSFHGDGGFYYDLMELATLTHHGIKVIIVIDNNGCLMANRSGMASLGMREEVAAWTELPPTDFVGVAAGMGVDGERVEHPEDLAAAVRRALDAPGSYLIDVATDPDTRLHRAVPNVVPILSDRPAKKGQHTSIGLEGSWPW
ncbi:thiamine pyrophosphate-binding protein [Amycolatopsis pithecellobii]|nr:thiamine pyrophosphate-binding protein [Amycolatopsis pithecellobii]